MKITEVKIEGDVVWVNAVGDRGARVARGFNTNDKAVQAAIRELKIVLVDELVDELRRGT